MADFKTHVTFSSVLGCGYAFAGMTAGVPTSTALVAGGLCGLSGMLPDVDSDSGIPRRETMGFAAAIVPMLLVNRFHQFQLTYDQMVLVTAGLYFGIRFGLSRLIGEFSVHRGMWHSIPAALIFAGLAFLITGSEDINEKYFKAFAVFLGTMSHLVLDEVYSVDTRGVIPKLKKSFGSAVKFWGNNPWANFSAYAKLAAVCVAIFGDVSFMPQLREDFPRVAGTAEAIGDRVRGFAQERFPAGAGQAAAGGWGASPQTAQPPAQGFQQPAPIQPWQRTPMGQTQPQGGFLPNSGGFVPAQPYYAPSPPSTAGGTPWGQR